MPLLDHAYHAPEPQFCCIFLVFMETEKTQAKRNETTKKLFVAGGEAGVAVTRDRRRPGSTFDQIWDRYTWENFRLIFAPKAFRARASPGVHPEG